MESRSALAPTTKAQVSGHKFLVRRIEHGLVMGDIRMIHDPLGKRHRAMVFGVVATVLLAVGAVALAVFRPAVDPGDAPVVRAESGALYVRIDDTVHPVANLASARLIVGESVSPENVSDHVLAGWARGVPVGLIDAPGLIAPVPPEDISWSVCDNDDGLHVVAQGGADSDAVPPAAVPEGAAFLARHGEVEYVVSAKGRAQLPKGDGREGRLIRRNLGVTADSPRRDVPPEMLTTIPELPAIALPQPLPQIVQAGARSWVRSAEGLSPLTPLQHAILLDAGADVTFLPRPAIADTPDAQAPDLSLPPVVPDWLDTTEQSVCSTPGSGVGLADSLPSGVELSGDSFARTFSGPGVGSVGVDSGHGYFLVDDTGVVHAVEDGDAMSALGISEVSDVEWSILRLLPRGSDLSAEAALVPRY